MVIGLLLAGLVFEVLVDVARPFFPVDFLGRRLVLLDLFLDLLEGLGLR